MDGSQGGIEEARLEPASVRRFLSDNPQFLTADHGLLDELGLKVAVGNVVDFGPAVMARVHAAHQREATQRQHLEETARANFSAQAQTHGAVVDLLEARNHSDLGCIWLRQVLLEIAKSLGPLDRKQAPAKFNRRPPNKRALRRPQMMLNRPTHRPRRL